MEFLKNVIKGVINSFATAKRELKKNARNNCPGILWVFKSFG
jgi:hypothetical protein